MASIIGTNIGYIFLTFLPPILWLLFYLREDRHPEPKSLLIFAFIGGMGSALLALFAECMWITVIGGDCRHGISFVIDPVMLFCVIALIEEVAKYLPVRLFVMQSPEFNEPVDAMIYMITSALGFAALENALFVFQFFYKITENAIIILPYTQASVLASIDVATNRFLGANLLHALSSGIVGFFLARAFFSPRRHHFVALGILVASLLHAGFNYLILIREILPEGIFYVILLLSIMTVMVFIDFERLKKSIPEKTLAPEPDNVV